MSVEQVRAATGRELKADGTHPTVDPPPDAELRLLRDDADPHRVYLR